MNYYVRRRIKRTLLYVFLGIFTFIIIFPYLWLAITSLKTRVDIFSIPPKFFFTPTLKNYISAFIEQGFSKYIINSLIISFCATFFSVIVSVLAAYAFSRYNFFGKRHIFFYVLTTRMAPPITIAVPIYLLANKFGVLDTRFIVILTHTAFNIALGVWLMKGFFDFIPKEIEEAAYLDGCSELGIFLRIALPLVKGGIVATAIFCLIMSWNEFLYALILTGEKTKPLTAAIPGFMTTRGTRWGEAASVGVVITLPVLIFAFIIQKHLIKGLTFGAIK